MNDISDEKDWQDFTKDIKKLGNNRAVMENDLKIPAFEARKDGDLSFESAPYERIAGQLKINHLPYIAHAKNVGVDIKLATKLSKGKLRIEARLDMHGMTQERAFNALEKFISQSYEQGKRCILVVTGKGRHQMSEGVLRSNMPKWLNIHHIRPMILMYSYAQAQHGGNGAIYILLKRCF